MLMDHTLTPAETQERVKDLLQISDGVSISILLALKQVLVGMEAVRADCRAQGARITELEKTVSEQRDYICDLENRCNLSDAYSGRTTVILANIPEDEHEDPDMLAERVSALAGVSVSGIGHVHRNRKRHPGKPRTVTLQFIRAYDKDQIMRRKRQLKQQCGVGVYHHMTPALIKTKEDLEKISGVNWVGFGGHSRMFTVNFGDNQVCTRVLSLSDFVDRSGPDA